MLIGVVAETDPAETRVAATPETVKKLIGIGAEVAVESGAGLKAGVIDGDYSNAGARIATAAEAFGADVVLKVRRPSAVDLGLVKRGALVVAIMDPYGHTEAIEAMAKAGVSAFAMELMPRITRAQVMDVLSSQANIAGYRARDRRDRRSGRTMSDDDDRGRHGSGGQALRHRRRRRRPQAIATDDASAPIVAATDVRPRPRSRSSRSGAKFVAVEDDEFKHGDRRRLRQGNVDTPTRPSRRRSSPRTSPSRTSSSRRR